MKTKKNYKIVMYANLVISVYVFLKIIYGDFINVIRNVSYIGMTPLMLKFIWEELFLLIFCGAIIMTSWKCINKCDIKFDISIIGYTLFIIESFIIKTQKENLMIYAYIIAMTIVFTILIVMCCLKEKIVYSILWGLGIVEFISVIFWSMKEEYISVVGVLWILPTILGIVARYIYNHCDEPECVKCGKAPNINTYFIWKCNSCHKTYNVNAYYLVNAANKKVICGKSLIKCKKCGNFLDDGKENITWKCTCGSIQKFKLFDALKIKINQPKLLDNTAISSNWVVSVLLVICWLFVGLGTIGSLVAGGSVPVNRYNHDYNIEVFLICELSVLLISALLRGFIEIISLLHQINERMKKNTK